MVILRLLRGDIEWEDALGEGGCLFVPLARGFTAALDELRQNNGRLGLLDRHADLEAKERVTGYWGCLLDEGDSGPTKCQDLVD